MLGDIWKDQAASAFALFKFVQSISTAASFFYSPWLGFYWQLLIAAISNIAGTVASVILEIQRRKNIENLTETRN